MTPSISIITLGVTDLKRSAAFYRQLGFALQTEESNEDITFFLLPNGMRLALYPAEKLAEDAQIPFRREGVRSFTMAYNVSSPEEVDAFLSHSKEVGAEILKPGQKVFWGGYSGYFSDPDGFLWEVAHNPFV